MEESKPDPLSLPAAERVDIVRRLVEEAQKKYRVHVWTPIVAEVQGDLLITRPAKNLEFKAL